MNTLHYAPRCALCLALAILPACSSSSIPRYAWIGTVEARQTMIDRDAEIESFSATCRLLLDGPRGRVELSGLLIARPPDRVRLRASKLSQTVFDLTMVPDGLFVFDRGRSDEQVTPTTHLTRDGLIEFTSLLPGFAQRVSWQDHEPSGAHFSTSRETGSTGARVTCHVDQRTLTLNQCDYADPAGVVQQSIRFFDYRAYGSVVWPMRITGSGVGGSFEVLFGSVEINPDLPSRAFVPSRRSVKQP